MSEAVAAIVLAAGASSRMGHFKLLADVGGKPMIAHTVGHVLASRARPVLVVAGNQADRVAQALAGFDVTCLENPDYAGGLAGSLKIGIAALPAAAAGAIVILGDMPEVSAADIDRLLAHFAPGRIVVPVQGGRRGNPVVWPRAAFPRILTLEGDAGARRLMQAFAADIVEVEIASPGIFEDIDTPEALAALRARRPTP